MYTYDFVFMNNLLCDDTKYPINKTQYMNLIHRGLISQNKVCLVAPLNLQSGNKVSFGDFSDFAILKKSFGGGLRHLSSIITKFVPGSKDDTYLNKIWLTVSKTFCV